MIDVNIMNVLDVSTLDLAMWVAKVIHVDVPRPGPNHTLNIQADILPLLADLANTHTLLSEFYVIVVGATPTQTTVRNKESGDSKAAAEVLNRKKDLIYQGLSAVKVSRETASRMITGAEPPGGRHY